MYKTKVFLNCLSFKKKKNNLSVHFPLLITAILKARTSSERPNAKSVLEVGTKMWCFQICS